MTIGERIKQRRLELKLSADEVAIRLGKNRATIYRYENSDIENLPTTVLEPLAKILETTPAYLMGWEKEIDANISKELQISKEALYTINTFSRTIDRSTGYSMMDLFNALVIHKNFEKIIKEMLLYISRSNEEWNKMTGYFSDDEIMESADVDSMKTLCRVSMVQKFEELIHDILNSNVATFNDVRKDENGNLIISAKSYNDSSVFNDINNVSKKQNQNASSNSFNIYQNNTDSETSTEPFTDVNEARKYLENHKIAAFNGGEDLSDKAIIQMANFARNK